MSTTTQIVPYYAHPHCHIVIYDNTYYDETVATPKDPTDKTYSTCAVVGADKGIDNTFVRLSDLESKKAIFGKGNFIKYGQPSLQADLLFTGDNNVWFMRTLPENATYANIVVLAHYRKGKILDDNNQETGLSRMEVKYSIVYANKPVVTAGATDDDSIMALANAMASTSADALTGYFTVPLFYIRSIGRGQYGNAYSLSVTRDKDLEKENNVKMYSFNLMETDTYTQVIGRFIGGLYQTTVNGMSTLIDDVIDQFDTGMCPITSHTFESNFDTLYDYYKNIVTENSTYLSVAGGSEDDMTDLAYAQSMKASAFDPVYGLKLNTSLDEEIPYYRNYTVKDTGAYVPPDLTIPDVSGATKPLNISAWTTAQVGSTCLVCADPLNNGSQWLYTVDTIDDTTGNITYTSGYEVDIDESEYDGTDITVSAGIYLQGGHDGDYQEITVNGTTRSPVSAEMKLLLAKDAVKAYLGEYDRKILSPAKTKLDFIFDANYNMTSDDLTVDDVTIPLYSNSTSLTDEDSQQLVILGSSELIMDFQDINVKSAMFALNTFRNRNGMEVDTLEGAGCSLFLDCNFTSLKTSGVNHELTTMANAMAKFVGRQVSIDLGYYKISDPYTGKKIDVTVGYFLAQKMMYHINIQGPQKPFVNSYAQMNAYQWQNSLLSSGEMHKGSFYPEIDLIDWDVKELLYTNRINYYISSKEGKVVQRATQCTRQTDENGTFEQASVLLEENNVRLLNIIKKELDEACRGYLYEWNTPEARQAYTDTQMAKFAPWIGTRVEDIVIRFDANEFEQERMMMHCYCEVKFRDIVKRVILEININRPEY